MKLKMGETNSLYPRELVPEAAKHKWAGYAEIASRKRRAGAKKPERIPPSGKKTPWAVLEAGARVFQPVRFKAR